jgi:predicted MFS family arabinose efflux permease
MSSIAYPLLVLALTGSPAKAGIVGFAQIVPYPLLVLPAGVGVDRWNRRRVMIVADVVRAVALASLAAAIALDRLTFPQIVVVALVEGTMFAFFNIAELGAMRSVVPAAQLPAAAAVEQARVSAVILAGPPLGGFLFGIGRALPFLVDAVSYAFSLISLLAMRTPFQEERERDTAPLRTQALEGFHWLWRHAFLRTCALLFGASNFAWNALFLIVVVAGRSEGLSSAAIGGVIAGFGGLNLIGSMFATRLQRTLSVRAIVLGALWLAVGVGAYVVRPTVYALVAGVVPLCLVNPALNATIIGYRVAITPDRLLGRVASVARLLAQIGAPLGPLVAGLLLESLSARATVGLVTLWFAGLALWATLSPAIRAAPSLDELAAT